jgi:hypothetical protein
LFDISSVGKLLRQTRVSPGHRGIVPHGPFKTADRLVQLFHVHQQIPEREVTVGSGGINDQRLLQGIECPFNVAGLPERQPQVVPAVGIVRSECDRSFKSRDRIAEMA